MTTRGDLLLEKLSQSRMSDVDDANMRSVWFSAFVELCLGLSDDDLISVFRAAMVGLAIRVPDDPHTCSKEMQFELTKRVLLAALKSIEMEPGE